MTGIGRGDAESVIHALNPLKLLVSLHSTNNSLLPQYRGRPIPVELGLSRTYGSGTPEERAEMEAVAAELRGTLEADPRFIRAAERLRGIGVSCKFDGQADAMSIFRVFRVTAAPDRLPLIEALAADDAGIVGDEARAAARRQFAAYIACNFHPDWQANRAHHVEYDTCPYGAP